MNQFAENQIDGEALLGLTERATETLIPIIGQRMKFLKLLEDLRGKKTAAVTPPQLPVVDNGDEVADEPQTSHQTRYISKSRLNMFV